ncbi:MAG: hypothetical protein ACK5LJ_08830 [Paracoccus sp. (in: a-proteobacteria)]
MNVFFQGALVLIVALVAVVVWLGICLDDDELPPSGWWVFPCILIGMLVVTGALV